LKRRVFKRYESVCCFLLSFRSGLIGSGSANALKRRVFKRYEKRKNPRWTPNIARRPAGGTSRHCYTCSPFPGATKNGNLYAARAGLLIGVANHRRDFQPQHDRPCRDWDKPARAATVFIHNGAPSTLAGRLALAHVLTVPRLLPMRWLAPCAPPKP